MNAPDPASGAAAWAAADLKFATEEIAREFPAASGAAIAEAVVSAARQTGSDTGRLALVQKVRLLLRRGELEILDPSGKSASSASRLPNPALRRKLVIAGIPETDHEAESLAAKVPDFDARAFQKLSPDMMAELVLYFIAKGLVNLPVAPDRALLDLPWGSHVCQFYNSKEDQLEMLVPYFKQGLERNEVCVWLLADLTPEEARRALQAAVPDLEHFLARQQMHIRHYTELYTNPDGSVKPADELSDQFAALASSVAPQGFSGLRASGSVSWIRDEANMRRFMDYEAKVNCAIQNSRIMAVCTYPAHASSMYSCRELIHSHGKFFVKRGEWVHDRSQDAQKIEAIFAALATA